MHREAQSAKWGWATRKREGADRVTRVRYSRDEPAFQKIFLTFDSSRAIQLKEALGNWINMNQGIKRDISGQVIKLASLMRQFRSGSLVRRLVGDHRTAATGVHALSRLAMKGGLPTL